jgi:sugar diacid utilization regulator
LETVQASLARDDLPLAMGISTLADGVGELPRACLEARAALQCLDGAPGIVALPRRSPFTYLALRADDTAGRLVDARVQAFLEEDRARGGVLVQTLRAFVDADLNARALARRLHVHPNTAHYRLARIEQQSGRNPRRVADLLELLIALALNDRAYAASPWQIVSTISVLARSRSSAPTVSGSKIHPVRTCSIDP